MSIALGLAAVLMAAFGLLEAFNLWGQFRLGGKWRSEKPATYWFLVASRTFGSALSFMVSAILVWAASHAG